MTAISTRAGVGGGLRREPGRDAGLRELRLTTQGAYLMELGQASEFSEAFADCATEAAPLKATLLLKNLLFGLGETIQVLEQERA